MSQTHLQYAKVFDGWMFDHDYEDDVRSIISHYLDTCEAIQETRIRLLLSLRSNRLDLSAKNRLHNHLIRLNAERRDAMNELLLYKCDHYQGEIGYEFTRPRKRQRNCTVAFGFD
jgi:hypothetical protein